ncbi:hypothetical protein ACTHPJ_22170 [Paenibacillus amylolyticus]
MGLSSYAAGLPCAGRERGSTLAAALALAFGCGRLIRSHGLCCRALRLSRQQSLVSRRILLGGLHCSGCARASRLLCTALFIRSSMPLRMPFFPTPVLAWLCPISYLTCQTILFQTRLSQFISRYAL